MTKINLSDLGDPSKLKEGDILVFNSGYETLVTYSSKGITKTIGVCNIGLSVVESSWEDYKPEIAGWKPRRSQLVVIGDEKHNEYVRFMHDFGFRG